MKIGVIGSGAMGSVYGALLAKAGNDVWMFDKWQDHVAAMRTRGLRCEGASGDRTVQVNATTRAADAGPCALAIVATKVMDIEAALADARAMIGPETLVLAIRTASAMSSACSGCSARKICFSASPAVSVPS